MVDHSGLACPPLSAFNEWPPRTINWWADMTSNSSARSNNTIPRANYDSACIQLAIRPIRSRGTWWNIARELIKTAGLEQRQTFQQLLKYIALIYGPSDKQLFRSKRGRVTTWQLRILAAAFSSIFPKGFVIFNSEHSRHELHYRPHESSTPYSPSEVSTIPRFVLAKGVILSAHWLVAAGFETVF